MDWTNKKMLLPDPSRGHSKMHLAKNFLCEKCNEFHSKAVLCKKTINELD